MSDPVENALRVLGLAHGATEEAIKDAYRDLVKVWHPDRFGSDERLREKAQERLKEINGAFERLRGYRPRPSTPPPPPPFPRYDPPPPVSTPFSASVERRKAGAPSMLAPLAVLAGLGGIAAVWLMMGRPETPAPAAPAARATQHVPPPSQPPRPSKPSAPSPATTTAPPQPVAAVTTGALRVSSRPTGARVVFDGRPIGETPVLVTEVAAGEHHVTVSLDGQGYEPWSTSVVVTAGREETLLAVMTPKNR